MNSGDAVVLAAAITAGAAMVTPVLTVIVQRRVQRENRHDHFTVRAVLLDLVGDVAEIRTSIDDLRSDLTVTTDAAEHTAGQVADLIEHMTEPDPERPQP